MNRNLLATIFNVSREVIEAAETPFAKLAIFILPIIAPLVPAIITGMRLYNLFVEQVNNENFSLAASGITAFALELFGYVGAMQFIHSMYKLVRSKNEARWLPVVLTGSAYLFYIAAMFLINIELSDGQPDPNKVFGLLALFSIPAAMLFADNLSQKEDTEQDEKLRAESREERLEKYRIKHGKVSESPAKVSENFRKETTKVSENLPKDWRKLRPVLSYEQVVELSQINAEQVKKLSLEYGVDERTVINWRTYAKAETDKN